jgi:peptidoglycan/xylan/chitin deacetylase (PgdA/CDA1 family)
VSITFDDFPATAWETGGRILARHGVRGTYYLAGRFCDGEFEGKSMIAARALAAIAASGHEIGSHTFNHKRLPGLSEREILAEFDANEAFVKAILPAYDLATFAYPYGSVSLGAKRLASRRFAACRGVRPGINAGTVDLGLLAGVCLEDHVLRRRSVSAWIREAVALKGWLIFLTHEVSDTPSPYGVTPRLLEEVVRTAIDAGCEVLPVRDALALVESRSAGGSVRG